ncbi:MAG: AI-2E family transporter [Candidatus Pacearchaeota archaeon]|jgi:predicted PurR-regulated permease PerM|nr:AI-2E family transporter [Candidatus Pacearchaeota archaeon]|tara:strand:- start:21230 stop:22264 length:1035 start_codon:yes stop_codon:yes gene_type:complete
MDKDYFNKIVTTIILGVLIVLSFFLLKPILLSIIVGIILAFIFNPVYNWIFKITKLQNLSAGLICVLLILLIFLPLWFFTPIFIEQSFEVYLASQQMDFVTPLKNIFPSLFASEEFSAEIGSVLYSFVTKMTNSLVNLLSQLILNFPTIFLQLIVTFFTFFFVLRDKDIIVSYLQSILPFSKDIEKKLFESSKGITSSVIYGQVIIGMIQGLIVGLGLFIFNIPNALFLTLLASLAGIFPIIGTTIVWLPIVIYLFIKGSTFSAIGITMFGITSNVIDNVIRPAFVSKKTRMHPLLVLIGMIGGLFLFGILGFIIGPLIIAYVLIILEIYRLKKTSGILTVLHE